MKGKKRWYRSFAWMLALSMWCSMPLEVCATGETATAQGENMASEAVTPEDESVASEVVAPEDENVASDVVAPEDKSAASEVMAMKSESAASAVVVSEGENTASDVMVPEDESAASDIVALESESAASDIVVPDDESAASEVVASEDENAEEPLYEEPVVIENSEGKSGNIASGKTKNITWVIDANGKLTLEGNGDFERYETLMAGSTSHELFYHGPWWEYTDSIVSAQVNVTGMTDASFLFWGCYNMTSVDLSGFSTDNVTDMRYMFGDCTSLKSLDMSKFKLKTDKVTNMSHMFDMRSMDFCDESQLTSLDMSGLNTSNVTDMSDMFAYCSSLTSLDVSKLKTDNVTDMSWMFSDCSGLTSLDVSKLKTDKVTDMSYMFWGCSGLTSLDVSTWKTDKVTSMRRMFEGCSGLTSLDVSTWKTDKVTNMSCMFMYCSGLTSLDISGFNTANVMGMDEMFYGCSSLTSLDVSGFNTANVDVMGAMFSGCSSLTSLDVSNFSTLKVDDYAWTVGIYHGIEGMFEDCKSLTSLDLSSFDLGNFTRCENLLDGCTKLTKINTPRNLKVSVALPAADKNAPWKDPKGAAVTELPKNLTDSILLTRGAAGKEYEVTFHMQGHGDAIKAVTVAEGEKVSKPAEPTAEGFTFVGWFKEAACITAWDFEKDIVTADTVLYAKWDDSELKEYTVTFIANGASAVKPQTVKEGKTVEEPADPKRDGFLFGGWYTDEACVKKFDFTTPVTADITLYARWEDASGLKIYFLDENGAAADKFEAVYTGSAIKPKVQVVYNGETLAKDEFRVSYANNVKAADKAAPKQPTVTVTGKGRFSGAHKMTFTILPMSLTELPYAESVTVVKGKKAVPLINFNGAALKSADYTIDSGAPEKWETSGSMKVTGKGNFKDSIQIAVQVVEESERKSIAVSMDTRTKLYYNGKVQIPAFTVEEKAGKDGGNGKVALTQGKDYIVFTSGQSVDAGKYKLTVIGIGEYTGSVTRKYSIKPAKLESCSATCTGKVPHNAKGAVPGDLLKVTASTGQGNVALREDVDYSVACSNNKRAGTAKFTVTFKGNYKGTKAINGTFEIAPRSMTEAKDVSVFAADKTKYTKPGVYKTNMGVVLDGTLLKSSDYTVQYYTDKECTKEMSKDNPVNIPEGANFATVYTKITGRGSYSGTITAGNYRVYRKKAKLQDLSKAKVKLEAGSMNYNGVELKPAVASVQFGEEQNVTVVPAECYRVSYFNNVNPGTAKVIVRGIEEKGYCGCKVVTFKVKKLSLANLSK